MSADRANPWEPYWERFAVSARANPAQAFRRRLIHALLGAGASEPGAAILDIGCGSGDLLAELGERYPRAAIAGVDFSHSGLAEARANLPRALLVQSDLAAGAPKELNVWATHAVCSEVLEHVDAPKALLAAADACLRPGGRLVVTVPGGPMSAFDRHIGHQRHYTRRRIASLLEEAGFEVELAAAAGFPLFNPYRMIVMLRGRRLIDDVRDSPGLLARSVMALFDRLLPRSLSDSPWGWQIVAVGRKRPVSAARSP
ncbi:MAG: class I SAM-dependent methyltransferase [Rhodospirillales bacterium]|jgi:SAM-dependent methyltransferase|nr:class I SAM-dependent methyltransferase [Rhodospirillales bacterium]MDP6883358.1 class I SAM-dependent methyltransferase [Rhodospirillales bacterium]